MKRNKLIIGLTVITSFGLGVLAMNKIFELSLAEYIKKNYDTVDNMKDNEVLKNYYEHWKNNR